MDKGYISSIRHAFGGAVKLAHYIGVSQATVESWCAGRRNPGAVEQRLLYALGLLMVDAPALFDVLVGRGAVVKPAPLPRVGPTLPALPPVPPRVKTPRVEPWDDPSYWDVRTVTWEERDAGDWPQIEDSNAVRDKLTPAQDEAYLASLSEYERRTGRTMPD